MKLIEKLKSNAGISMIELLVTISIMSLLTIPAYMSVINGYKLFDNESAYQAVLGDVQLAYDQMNTHIRIAGFRDIEVIDNLTKVGEFDGLISVVPNDSIHVLKVGNIFYYYKNGSLYRYSDRNERELVDNVVNFLVEELDDGQLITLNITINVDGRQETIQTRVYYRYQEGG